MYCTYKWKLARVSLTNRLKFNLVSRTSAAAVWEKGGDCIIGQGSPTEPVKRNESCRTCFRGDEWRGCYVSQKYHDAATVSIKTIVSAQNFTHLRSIH